jgi:hypothetical protein
MSPNIATDPKFTLSRLAKQSKTKGELADSQSETKSRVRRETPTSCKSKSECSRYVRQKHMSFAV